MKKSLAISFLLFPFCFFTHCFAQKPTTAFELNNYLSDINDSISSKEIAWETALSIADSIGNYSKLIPIRIGLEKLIDADINDVKTLTDIGGSEDFRKAVIHFLLFEKALAANTLKPFENLKSSSSKSDIDKLESDLDNNSKMEDDEIHKVRVVQLDYAAKNGFTVEPDGDPKK